MEITPDHPVHVEGKGWLWAENLALGDKLRRSDGGIAKVLAVERVKLAEPELVYNFTVKGPHTYFVLEVGVLVHNAGITCARVKSGNPWRNEKGQFAKTPDFDEEMGVFTTPDTSPFPELAGEIVDRPIAKLDPETGKPVSLADTLERRSGEWFPEEVRWSQKEFSNKVGYPPEVKPKIELEAAVAKLEQSGRYPGQMVVFEKLPTMQEPNWQMTVYDRQTGEIFPRDQLVGELDPERYYTGDYANLENGKKYSLNNRTWTVSNLVPLERDIDVPMIWASRQEIERLSYQFSAVEQGRLILPKDPTRSIVKLPSQR